jgi:uncharacterized Zn-finger protein
MNSAETGQNDTASVSQITYTNENRVSCNGGGGALGHPLVWLTLGGDGRVTCPYCSRLFIMVRPKPEV